MSELPRQLIIAIERLVLPSGMKLTAVPERENESREYHACRFAVDGRRIVFRVAKTTPTKIGQFVTLWKRPTPSSEIAPINAGDQVALAMVSIEDGQHAGYFVFAHQVLLERNIFSLNGVGGKRAFRVYPPWSKPMASAAVKTKAWQGPHFLSMSAGVAESATALKRLLSV